MKRNILFLIFTFLFASNFSFAAFPINNNHINDANTLTSKETTEELVHNSKIIFDSNSIPTNVVEDKSRVYQILSLSFSAISILFSVLSMSTDDLDLSLGFLVIGLVLLIPAIIFAVLYYTFK